jgi:Na+/melibiose symporter-like transporter
MGRRLATLVFDVLGWSVPMLLWAFAQDVRWFVAAALFNGIWRVTQNSWLCLLMEDLEDRFIMRVFSIASLAGLVSGFFAPITYFLMGRFEMVPVVRCLYLFSFVMMTLKFILLFRFTTETKMGKRRMEETKGVSVAQVLLGYGGVAKMILHNPKTLLVMALWTLLQIASSTTGTFWPLLVTSRVAVSQQSLSLFATVKTLTSLVCYVTFVPLLSAHRFRTPAVLGFGLVVGAQILLMLLPSGAAVGLVCSVVLEAVGLSIINPLKDALQMLHVDAHERARILGIFQAAVLLCTAPFGYLTGLLSSLHRLLPFLLVTLLYILAALCALRIARENQLAESQMETVE